jgi:SAM-dependent methyltransferase
MSFRRKMDVPTSLEEYLKKFSAYTFLGKVGVSNSEVFVKEVEYFTIKEARKRDKILIEYFGCKGVNLIVKTVTNLLFAPPQLSTNAKVLDIGAGTGFFTAKIAEKVRDRLPNVSFYAMDITPAMLISLAKKNLNITPFVGIAENIRESIKEARKHFNVPNKFDAVFSTLMLHHSIQPEKVFKNLKEVLKKNGKAIIVDLCEHEFEEFRKEMGDVHLGFKPESIYEMAKMYFSNVKVETLPGICCKCSGRSAEIFVAFMRN